MLRLKAILPLAIGETFAWGLLHYAFSALLARRPAIAGGFSVALLGSALAAPFVARAVARIGARRVMLAGALVATVSLVGLALTERATFWALLGVAQAATLYEPAFAAIASWFRTAEERRRALVVVTVLGGTAGTIFVPLVTWISGSLSYRATLLALGCMVAASVLPAYASLPEERSAAAVPRAVRTVDVGPLAVAFAVHSFVATGAMVHLVRHLAEGGRSVETAASLAALAGLGQVAGRLVLTRVGGAASTRTRILTALATEALALLLVGRASNVVAGAGVVLFGAANGVLTIERPVAVLERFGEHGFASASGKIATAALLARAAAPFVVATAAAAGGAVAFVGLAAAAGLAAVIFRASFDLPLRLSRRDPQRCYVPFDG